MKKDRWSLPGNAQLLPPAVIYWAELRFEDNFSRKRVHSGGDYLLDDVRQDVVTEALAECISFGLAHEFIADIQSGVEQV